MRRTAAAVFMTVGLLIPVVNAAASPEPPRGEAARLDRQAYDYTHRNSNRNVFRRSRHFHPTRNAFRSSRHYDQRVAASSDGYPLRTWIRFGDDRGHGTRERVFSFAHHRRQPYGSGGGYFQGPGYFYPGDPWVTTGAPVWHTVNGGSGGVAGPATLGQAVGRANVQAEQEELPRTEIKVKKIRTADGRVKTLIFSPKKSTDQHAETATEEDEAEATEEQATAQLPDTNAS